LNKPAGMLALPDLTEGPSLLRLAENYLVKAKNKRTGRSFVATEIEPEFLGPCHRLDAPVSGCVLFTKSPEAAKHFAAHFRRK
jgi:23S rRNA-/tRNA-specific pseudouridylate synthase